MRMPFVTQGSIGIAGVEGGDDASYYNILTPRPLPHLHPSDTIVARDQRTMPLLCTSSVTESDPIS